MQIISNDKLKSVNHRVIANLVGPRISVGLFLRGVFSSPKLYEPIEELLCDESAPIYKNFTLNEFKANFFTRPLDQPGFQFFKLKNQGDGE